MICTDVYIDKYGWLVHCFFAVDSYYKKSILSVLDSLGCSRRIYELTSSKLERADLDTGFTYTNSSKRESLFVVGLASSKNEYINSISHELRHLCDDIANECGIIHDGEEVAYLTGDVAMAMSDAISVLTCDCQCCKSKRYRVKSIYYA